MFHGGRKLGRQEKEVRHQSRAAWVISRVLLLACMVMTGAYGWTAGGGHIAGGIAGAVLFAAIDLCGATLIRMSGTSSVAKANYDAWGQFFVACICAGVAWWGIMGFVTETREAKVQARTRAAQISSAYLDWSKNVVTDSLDKSRGRQNSTNVGSAIDAVGKVANEQIKMLQDGGLHAVTDGLGADPNTRWWQNAILAGAFLFVTYASWFYYGRHRNKIEPAIVAQEAAQQIANPRQLSAHNPNNSDNLDRWTGYTHEHARADLALLVNNGLEVSARGVISNLAKRWGWSPQRVRRWLSEQAEFKLPPPRKRTRQVDNRENSPFLVATPNGKVHAS